jgi:hypothetical protein
MIAVLVDNFKLILFVALIGSIIGLSQFRALRPL